MGRKLPVPVSLKAIQWFKMNTTVDERIAKEILESLSAIDAKVVAVGNSYRPEFLDLTTLSKVLCVSKRKLEELFDHPINPLRPHLFKIDGIGKWLIERDEALTWFRRFRAPTDEDALKKAARVKMHRHLSEGG